MKRVLAVVLAICIMLPLIATIGIADTPQVDTSGYVWSIVNDDDSRIL